jgi:Zn-finger nucleic acid-binding protein
VPGSGLLGEAVCPRCQGRFLPGEVTDRVVVDELGIGRDVLRALTNFSAGRSLRCSGCGAGMRALQLRGVPVDLCLACGGLWLDAGELRRLSAGRHAEIAAQVPQAAPGDHRGADDDGYERRRVVLGRGVSAVVLDELRPPPLGRLQAAFARTDALTSVDADTLADFCPGVVVAGVTADGAAGLVAALADEGIAAHIVGEAALRLPPPLLVEELVVEPVADGTGLAAFFRIGPPLRCRAGAVRAIGGGLLPTTRDRGGAVATIDVVVGGTAAPGGETRRLRWMPLDPTAAAVSALVRLLVGHGGRAGRLLRHEALAWHSYRTARDFDRELGWLAWSHARGSM